MHRQVDNSESHVASMIKKEAKYGMKVAHLFKAGQESTLPHILSNRSDHSTLVSNSAPKLAKALPVVAIGGMPRLQMATSPRSQQFQHIPRLVVAPAMTQTETETSETATNGDMEKLLSQISKLKQTVQLQKELLSDKSYQIQLMSQEISMLRLSNEKLAQTNSEAVAQAKAREKEHIEQNKRLNATIGKLMREKEHALQYLMHYQIHNGTLEDPANLVSKSGVSGLSGPKLELDFLNIGAAKAAEESSSMILKHSNPNLKSLALEELRRKSTKKPKNTEELAKQASDMADQIVQQVGEKRCRVKPYDSEIMNSKSEEQLNNSSMLSREVAGSTEDLKNSKRNTPQRSKRLLATDDQMPHNFSVEKSPRVHKTSQIQKAKAGDRPLKQAVDPITAAICLQLGRDSVNLILDAASNRYAPTDLIDTLRDLIKHFQKSFRAGFGEIVFFNPDFINLVLETNPGSTKKLREVLEDKTPILLIRPTIGTRERMNVGSIESEANSLHILCNELTFIKVEHKPHIKNGCFFLPLVTSFGAEESRVVGVLTMAKFGRSGGFEYGGGVPAEDKDVLAKLQKAPVLKDLYSLVSQFFTVLTTDLKRHRAQMDAERAAKICKIYLTSGSLFKFSHEINSALYVLRTEMPDILGYEEVCFLIKPLHEHSDSLVSVSPNSSKDSLKNSKRCETFFFSPHFGFTMDTLRNGKMQHILTPRDYENFADGVDCLAPTVYLKEILYVPLVPLGETTPLGVMQLVNKNVGNISHTDVSLITTLAPAIGNWISLIIKGTKLSDTVDKVVDRVRRATKDYENLGNL